MFEGAVIRSFDWMSRQAVQMLATGRRTGLDDGDVSRSSQRWYRGGQSERELGGGLHGLVPCCPPTNVPDTKTFAPDWKPEPVKVMVLVTPAVMVLGLTDVIGAPGVVIS